MARKINQQDIERIANLAKLSLSSEEKTAAETYLNEIIGYADRIAEVDTSKVEPFLGDPTDTEALREDRIEPFPERAELVSGRRFEGGLLVTKAVFKKHKDDR